MLGCGSIQSMLIWWGLPLANLLFWYYTGYSNNIRVKCGGDSFVKPIEVATPRDGLGANGVDCEEDARVREPGGDEEKMPWERIRLQKRNSECSKPIDRPDEAPRISIHTISNDELERHRVERMATMTFASQNSVLISAAGTSGDGKECRTYEGQWANSEVGACFAVVFLKDVDQHRNSYAIQRFDRTVDENNHGENDKPEPHHPLKQPFVGNEHNKGHKRPVGFFRKTPASRGFQRVQDKLGPFVKYYNGADGIASQLDEKLYKHNIKSGDDVTLMVVNEGEIDLWLNFACSCKHNDISMKNVFVFAASPEIIPLIESTGAMALYHVGYASVSKKASNDYLDRVFVDMMWYKAFSVHLLSSRGINVLFQDVDLVWFRNPFDYFKEYISTAKERSLMSGSHPEGFYSDDGQRSLRYSPFFANSGFYYLLGSPRSTYLAWSIMISFDAVQVLGSHQNVFTAKMVEGLSLGYQHAVILPLYKFPTGILYHHDRKYMKRLKKGEEKPYGFHMCWTQGKPDKLKYLRKAGMWYLTDTCSPLPELIEGGSIFNQVEKASRKMKWTLNDPAGGAWAAKIDSTCCTFMDGGPGL